MTPAIIGGLIVGIPLLLLVLGFEWSRSRARACDEATAAIKEAEREARRVTETTAMQKVLSEDCHKFHRELNAEVSKAFVLLTAALQSNTEALLRFSQAQMSAASQAADKIVEVAEKVAHNLEH